MIIIFTKKYKMKYKMEVLLLISQLNKKVKHDNITILTQ